MNAVLLVHLCIMSFTAILQTWDAFVHAVKSKDVHHTTQRLKSAGTFHLVAETCALVHILVEAMTATTDVRTRFIITTLHLYMLYIFVCNNSTFKIH